MDPTVVTLLKFLTFLFEKRSLSYSSLNTARSAVSTFSLAKKTSLGSHPLISQFMKGVFNLKPKLPKTSFTWDTGIVLKYLQKWHPSKNLDLLQLSIKVTLLCLLVAGQRGQTIWALNLNNITWGGDRVTCRIGEVLKTTSEKRHQDDLVFLMFSLTLRHCVLCII